MSSPFNAHYRLLSAALTGSTGAIFPIMRLLFRVAAGADQTA